MADRENKAAWLTSAGGSIEVGPAPLWEPEKGQIRIKVYAAPLTPADAVFSSATPPFTFTYPLILSSTVGGTVDAVGEGVTKLAIGDRVVSGTKIWTSRGESKYGGLQRYTIVEEAEAIEIGDTPFADAIAAGMQTAIGALFGPSTLNMTRPSTPPNPAPNGKKILIWGGASAMGAVSISHASAAGYTVITTCSPHNFDFVKSLGASRVFDYHTEEKTIEDIKRLFPIDHFYDCVSLRSSIIAMAQIARAVIEAGRAEEVVIQTLTPLSMVGNPTLPEGVTAKMVLFRNGAQENKDVVEWMLKKGGYLERGLKEGWFRGVRGEVVGGLESANDGLIRRKMENLSGVSASRLIVEPWKL